MNEGYLRTVVRAALDDLVAARETHGERSTEYRAQIECSARFILGSLEEVLTAALRDLHRGKAQAVAADAPKAARR